MAADWGSAETRLRSELKDRARSRRAANDRAHEAKRRTAAVPGTNDLRPHLELVERRADQLKAPARAVRKLAPSHVTEVSASIRALGFCHPILINAQDEILDGVTRHAAAIELGLMSVPCVVLRDLTPAAQRAARIALNRLAEKGTWDLEELRVEIEELIDLDVPIEIMGFEAAELDLILADEDSADLARDEQPPLEATPVSRVGDGWILGDHRVLCADARQGSSYGELMGEELARLVFTDPPYNVRIAGHVSGLGKHVHREFVVGSGELSPGQFLEFLALFIQSSMPFVLDGGLIASFMDWRGIATLLSAGDQAGLQLLNMAVWSKSNAGMGSLWRSAYELVAVFKVGEAPHVNNVELGRHGRWRSNVWTYPGGSSLGSDAREGLADHPTPKPVALIEDVLYDVTDRGEIVLDPFLGSGSTVIAAEVAGRRCYGMELDPIYCDLSVRRWAAFTGQQPILAATGETFEEVRARRRAAGAVSGQLLLATSRSAEQA